MIRFALIALALAAGSGAAAADEVVLRNGQKLAGIAREEGKQVVVEIGAGTVSFPRDQVVSITPGPTPLHEYRDRYEAIRNSPKAQDFYELAKWARERGVSRYVRPLLQRTLELDPNHEWARRDLGFTRHEGKWLTADELRREQGFVPFEGRWVTTLEKNLILKRRVEAEMARAAEAAARERRREEEHQRRLQLLRERQDRLLELERRRPDLEDRRRGRRFYGGDTYGYIDVFGYLDALDWFGRARTRLPIPSDPPIEYEWFLD